MPSSTGTPWALPAPLLTEAPNGPVGIKALADALHPEMGSAWPCTSSTRPAHRAGRVIYETDTSDSYTSNGTAWVAAFRTWLDWSPVWSQVGGSALAIGNGTLAGRYSRSGNLVTANCQMTRGSTTNQGTTTYTWSLPFPAATFRAGYGVGHITHIGGEYPCTARLITGTDLVLLRTDTRGRVSNSDPGSWAAGDILDWQFTYERA